MYSASSHQATSGSQGHSTSNSVASETNSGLILVLMFATICAILYFSKLLYNLINQRKNGFR